MPTETTTPQANQPQPVATEPTSVGWEKRIADLLDNLSQVQGDLLGVLGEKRERLAAGDFDNLDSFAAREAELVARLEACHGERQSLLTAAAREGLPAGSVQSLAQALPASEQDNLLPEVKEAQKRSRLLQHQSLTNWVVVQRTLIHLSQMIEIIATGGRMRPTYGKEETPLGTGALVDQEA